MDGSSESVLRTILMLYDCKIQSLGSERKVLRG